jgi:transcriptional regulator of acetoin/glycerol metabolism
MLERASTPILALDARQVIVFANPALQEWLGLTAEQLLGRRCDYRAATDDPIAAACAALCPPPEAFTGQVTAGAVSRLAGPDRPFERRPARFVRISGEQPDESLLLVIVNLEVTATNQPTSHQSAERLHATLTRLRSELGQRYHISQLLGESEAISRVREQVRVAAEAGARVLIIGNAGSGREHVARTIHFAQPAKSIGPLVPIDCSLTNAEQMQAALTTLLRRQHESPTQRPPAALLLDVDRLREGAQQELAGFFQLPGIELHTLATAKSSLERLAKRGRFRPDLAYALSTLKIVLPPLADRRGDIPLLAQHFLEECGTPERSLSGFHPAALELLTHLRWPGNIDQLAEAVRAACAKAAGPRVLPPDLPQWTHLAAHADQYSADDDAPVELDAFLAEVERELLARALRRARGNKSRAAQLLGTTRQRLLRRLAHFGLIAPSEAEEPIVFHPVEDEPAASGD